MGVVSELRRRNVLRMAALYVVAAWLIMQVAEVLVGLANLPEWVGPTVLALLAIGFPIALVVSWFYEVTPEGISLEHEVEPGESIRHVVGRRVDFIIIALLCAGLILFAYDKWWVGPPPEKSIAVLAFQNMSDNAEQEYFADGISEEVLNLLAQLPELAVISRSSAFAFKGKDTPIPEIAEQLNVAHVLEGSVRRAGNRIRITAQLIDARSDSHLWSQTYERELDDIFAVQDEIAGAISDALRVRLVVDKEKSAMPLAIKATSTEAYDAFLKGRELIHHRTKDAFEQAISYLERSISLANDYAPAHAQLAIATVLYRGYSWENARRTAFRHLDRAQTLEPNLPEAHAGRALLALNDDAEAAIEHARKALAVNPSYIDAMTWLRIALGQLGRREEAHEVLEQMLVSDPLSIVARLHYANWLAGSGRIEEAHDIADRIIEQSPKSGYTLHAKLSYWNEGDLDKAVYWALKGSLSSGEATLVFTDVGEFDEARRLTRYSGKWIDFAEGRWEDAIAKARKEAQQNPNSQNRLNDAADILYRTGLFEEALPLYERALDFAPEGRTAGSWGAYYAMQLALMRRKAGDEEGAQAVADLVRQELSEDQTAGGQFWESPLTEAKLAAFDNDPDATVSALRVAIQRGFRWHPEFDDPLYEMLRYLPAFIALEQELDAFIADEHDEVLQLICFNNPVPDDWRPLPKTCEGVIQQPVL